MGYTRFDFYLGLFLVGEGGEEGQKPASDSMVIDTLGQVVEEKTDCFGFGGGKGGW